MPKKMSIPDGYTQYNASEALGALDSLFEMLSKRKQMEAVGDLNTIALFLEAIKRVLPED